jgi:hypothetical protein
MTQTFSPSEAALSVFELAKRQPQFVLRFCIIYALGFMLTYALAGATGVGKAMQDYVALASGGRAPDPARVLEVLAPAGTGFAIMLVFSIVTGAVTSAMGLRKAVRDEDHGLYGLQLGKDELNMLLATMLFTAILVSVNFATTLIGGLITGGNPGFMFLAIIIGLIGVGFLGLRLGQFGVLTIASGQVTVRASWSQTKGHVWRFAGAYLLWIIIATIIGIIAQSLGALGASALAVKVGSGMPASLGEFLKPGWLFYALIYGLATGLGNLGTICVGAYAWHQMSGNLPAPKTPI